MSKQTDFFNKYGDEAIESQRLYGVPASVTLAQAALESSWGESSLTKEAYNFFGIKADSTWKGEYVVKITREVKDGQSIYINSKFRKYKNAKESFTDHALFLKKFSRYKGLFSLKPTDYKGWSNGLQSSGYATALEYGSTLISIIEKYKLYEYDNKANVDVKK